MQINLKQAEIVQALRAYVVAQGINLTGKDVDISFTAGRRESGISADITIEDAVIPGYTNAVSDEAPEVSAHVVTLAVVPTASEVVEADAATAEAKEVQAEAPAVAAAPVVEEAQAAEPKAPGSLFS
jgi:hypothetical protein